MSPLRRPFCPPLAIAAAMGSAPTSKIRRKLRNLLCPWGPCPYHLPPRNRRPWTPPKPHERRGPTLSCNQGPWSTPLSTRPAPVRSPPLPDIFLYALETSKIRHKLRNLLRPWGPCPYPPPSPNLGPRGLGPRGASPFKQPFLMFGTPTRPQPSPATKALGLPPCQLRWVPPPHRASVKKRHFSSFCTR